MNDCPLILVYYIIIGIWITIPENKVEKKTLRKIFGRRKLLSRLHIKVNENDLTFMFCIYEKRLEMICGTIGKNFVKMPPNKHNLDDWANIAKHPNRLIMLNIIGEQYWLDAVTVKSNSCAQTANLADWAHKTQSGGMTTSGQDVAASPVPAVKTAINKLPEFSSSRLPRNFIAANMIRCQHCLWTHEYNLLKKR